MGERCNNQIAVSQSVWLSGVSNAGNQQEADTGRTDPNHCCETRRGL